jgi:hypothetical protein
MNSPPFSPLRCDPTQRTIDCQSISQNGIKRIQYMQYSPEGKRKINNAHHYHQRKFAQKNCDMEETRVFMMLCSSTNLPSNHGVQ